MRTKKTVRVTLDLDVEVGTLREENEVTFKCGTLLLDLIREGKQDDPVSDETVRSCAATTFDVLVKTANLSLPDDAVVRFLRVREVR